MLIKEGSNNDQISTEFHIVNHVTEKDTRRNILWKNEYGVESEKCLFSQLVLAVAVFK